MSAPDHNSHAADLAARMRGLARAIDALATDYTASRNALESLAVAAGVPSELVNRMGVDRLQLEVSRALKPLPASSWGTRG